MRYFILLAFVFCLSQAFAQDSFKQYDKFWIEFTDKDNTPYSVLKPQEYLSPRAIERRRKQGIAIEENDLPVDPNYILGLRDLGAKVNYTSKWFNAASITADSQSYARILKLPFVKSGEPVGYSHPKRTVKAKSPIPPKNYSKSENPYGSAANQITMLNGHTLHDMGYDGDGMLVAVLDGGFTNTDIMPFFDSLRADGRLLEGRDFVDNDNYPYESSSHGSQVLSTMAANLPGLMIGTAPGATYVCVKTEETGSELRIEEDNWVVGAEFADSLGADVLNSSLGYTRFDDKSMNYSYKDMDGNTARCTQGADIAASKGILVVNSAGNSGAGDWKYIGAPSDGDFVFAVAAVDAIGRKAYFSSFGPGSQGLIKPNISAKGSSTTVGSLYSYEADRADGTSFASPVMAGMVTSLWQAFPDKTNLEIMDAVQESAHLSDDPSIGLGYGIPDVYQAYLSLSGAAGQIGGRSRSKSSANTTFNRVKDKYVLSFWCADDSESVVMEVQDLLGNIKLTKEINVSANSYQLLTLDNLDNLEAGVYFVAVKHLNYIYYQKFIKA